MKYLFLACLFITALSGLSAQNKDVVIGRMDTLQSQILHEQRICWIHLPPSARSGDHPLRKYPVVYVLDGDLSFTSAVGMIDVLSSVNGNTFLPEMIVVGILNTNRRRDLTPTHVSGGLWIGDDMAKSSGGGEAFTSFIEKELVPYIDLHYPASHYRMLIGHSLGGLMAVNTFIHHTKLFSSYIAIDPSMWWDQQKLLQQAAGVLKISSYSNTSIFLGMAHTQIPGMDTTMLQSDTTEGTFHPRSILQLSRYLLAARRNGLQASYKYYDEETHSSVPLLTTYDGLRFIFKDYGDNFQDSYFSDSTFQLASFLEDHYKKISTEYLITADDGSQLFPPMDLVNNLGFFVLQKKQYVKAEAMFTMNIKNYPANPVAYQYLGDLYAAKGDKAKAVDSYKKSLSFKEDAEVRKKLLLISN